MLRTDQLTVAQRIILARNPHLWPASVLEDGALLCLDRRRQGYLESAPDYDGHPAAYVLAKSGTLRGLYHHYTRNHRFTYAEPFSPGSYRRRGGHAARGSAVTANTIEGSGLVKQADSSEPKACKTGKAYHLYQITTNGTELYLGWTSPPRARRLLTECLFVFPAARLEQIPFDLVKGYWATAWDCYLAHFWTGHKATMCGTTHMFPHSSVSWHAAARGVCKQCQKRYQTLLAQQET